MVISATTHCDEKLADSYTTIVHPMRRFVLKSNSDFASRVSNVFHGLSSLESNHNKWMTLNETHDSFESVNNSAKNTSVLFKKPSVPALRRRRRPLFYKRNTETWIKYSLKDIPISSDATNAVVAFQFLDELRKRKKNEESDDVLSQDDRIVFRKPSKKNFTVASATTVREVDEPISQQSQSINSVVNIKLDHLQNDPEDSS